MSEAPALGRTIIVSVRLEPEMMDRISRAAEGEHRSVSNYIRHVLMEHLADVDFSAQKVGG